MSNDDFVLCDENDLCVKCINWAGGGELPGYGDELVRELAPSLVGALGLKRFIEMTRNAKPDLLDLVRVTLAPFVPRYMCAKLESEFAHYGDSKFRLTYKHNPFPTRIFSPAHSIVDAEMAGFALNNPNLLSVEDAKICQNSYDVSVGALFGLVRCARSMLKLELDDSDRVYYSTILTVEKSLETMFPETMAALNASASV